MSETWKIHNDHPCYACSPSGKVRIVDENLAEVNLPKYINEAGEHYVSIFLKSTNNTQRKSKLCCQILFIHALRAQFIEV